MTERPAGAAREGFRRGMARALLAGLACWQFVMIAGVLWTDGGVRGWVGVLGHVVVLVVLVAAVADHAPGWVVIAALYLALIGDFRLAHDVDSPLVLAAAWIADMTYVLPALLYRGIRGVIIALASALAAGLAVEALCPSVSPTVPRSMIPGSFSMIILASLLLPALFRLADRTDAEATTVAEQRRVASIAETTAREAAEDNRLLHDTVINTLAALASGGGALRDREAVRSRCRSDAETMRRRLSGMDSGGEADLDEVWEQIEVPRVVRTGIPAAQVRELCSLMPAATTRAVAGALREGLTNVAKHAQVPTARVNVETDGSVLVVTVEDDGVGFEPARVRGHGIEESLVGRMAEVGGTAELSSAPGRGTTVTLRAPRAARGRSADAAGDTHGQTAQAVRRLRRRACWLWAAGVVVIGVLIEIGNNPGHVGMTYAMLAFVALVSSVTAAAARGLRPVPAWVVGMLFVAIPASYLLAMSGVGFGTHHPLYLQAIGFTPVFVAILVGRGPRALAAAVGGYLVTVAGTAVVVAVTGNGSVPIVVIGSLPAVLVTAGWYTFYRVVGALVASAEHDRRATTQLAVEAGARQAMAEDRSRWRRAAVRNAVALLEQVAAGDLDFQDEGVRRRFGEEERYLRQLILMRPNVYRIAAWLARALAEARARGVQLDVRSGETDVDDQATADALGEFFLDVVAATPSGSGVTVGVYPGATGPSVVVVGQGEALARRYQGWSTPDDWEFRARALGDQSLIEIWPRHEPAVAGEQLASNRLLVAAAHV